MSAIPILRFCPDQDGAARWLPPMKAAILDYLFDAAYPRTVRQVWRAVGDGRALTTVQTHLLHMTAAGLLIRSRQYISTFAPALSRAEFEVYQFDAMLRAIGRNEVEQWLDSQPREVSNDRCR